jgi:hypothetical protein
MLRSLFQGIEQSLGSSLDTVATVAYWLGVVLLAHRLLSPLFRLRMEMVSARLKLEESVVMECPYCHRETVVHDAQCAFCRKSLELPFAMRAWHFVRLRRQPMWWRRTRWTWDSLGLATFVALTVAGFVVLHAWSPAGPLQRLFIGLALLCWVAISWLVARVLHLGSGGPIARLRDTIFAFAVAGALAICLVFAAESRPIEETVMWRIPVGEGGIARIGSRPLTLPQGMIGFEYLQVDHEMLGYHHVIPLAFLVRSASNSSTPASRNGSSTICGSAARATPSAACRYAAASSNSSSRRTRAMKSSNATGRSSSAPLLHNRSSK